MKKSLIFFCTLLILNMTHGQEESIEAHVYSVESSKVKIDEIKNYPVNGLIDNDSIIKLKEKLNSNLNTIASCVLNYKFSKVNKLTSDEEIQLLNRISQIVEMFIQEEKYFYFQLSTGYAPVYGIELKTINNKEVKVIHLGGGCLINEVKKKENEVYAYFNAKMESYIED